MSMVLHLDKHLSSIVEQHGGRTYALLFAIIFAETGFVLTPFLPGDSLLFATGTLAAMGLLDMRLLLAVCITAAVLGDAVNYAVGAFAGRLHHWPPCLCCTMLTVAVYCQGPG